MNIFKNFPINTGAECLAVIKQHLAGLLGEKGEYIAVREMRKFISWYVKGYRGASEIRRRVNTITSYDELLNFLQGIELD